MPSVGIFNRKIKLTANRQGRGQQWVVDEPQRIKLERIRVSRTRSLRALAAQHRLCQAPSSEQVTLDKEAYPLFL